MDISSFNQNLKLAIYRKVEESGIFNYFCEIYKFTDFVNSVWNVVDMPSEDSRFGDKYGDIKQHYENNDDYEYDELFLSKLRIQDDENLEKFLKSIPDPRWYENLSEQELYIGKLNSVLRQFKLTYRRTGQNANGFDIYELDSFEDIPDPDFAKNKIPIYFVREAGYPTYAENNHPKPDQFPAIVFAFDWGWDDFGKQTMFDTFYHDGQNEPHHLGKAKIIASAKLLPSPLPTEFSIMNCFRDNDNCFVLYELPDGFCSLGQNDKYYSNLFSRIIDKEKLRSLFWALKDIAVFPYLQDIYCESPLWSSLTRSDTAERMLRFGRNLSEGKSGKPSFGFKYHFKPKYSSENTQVAFDFNNRAYFPRRIFALIGKNGSGKTQLLTSIPLHLKWRSAEAFEGEMPLFSKLIAISNSHFDNFDIPESSKDFNYVYSGLSKKENGQTRSLSLEEIKTAICDNLETIKKKGRIPKFKKLVSGNISDNNIWNSEFTNSVIYREDDEWVLKLDAIRDQISISSSGSWSLLYFLSNILANIRLDSLLLVDEPENHLHPNAISRFISILFDILEDYDSYSIIGTHSPLVVREIRGENVMVVERIDDTCIIRKIGIDSLGANLSSLVDLVFFNNEIPRHYRKEIDEMIGCEYSKEKIIESVRSEGITLSLPVEMYIHSKFLSLDNKQ